MSLNTCERSGLVGAAAAEKIHEMSEARNEILEGLGSYLAANSSSGNSQALSRTLLSVLDDEPKDDEFDACLIDDVWQNAKSSRTRVDDYDARWLSQAALNGDFETVAVALASFEHGRPTAWQDHILRSCLHRIADVSDWQSIGHQRVAETIVAFASETECNCKDRSSWTPLHYAARSGNSVMVKLLLERGADPTLTDAESLTPAHWAKVNGHDMVRRSLAEAVQKRSECIHDNESML